MSFLPAIGGVELLFSTSFFFCCFEMAEGFSRVGIGPRCTYNFFQSVIDSFIIINNHITLGSCIGMIVLSTFVWGVDFVVS
jgi:hypothetical protein